jgi:hypothetical protein
LEKEIKRGFAAVILRIQYDASEDALVDRLARSERPGPGRYWGPGHWLIPPRSNWKQLAEGLEQQLGLKLEKSKETLDVLVVDHVEAVPTEN